MVKNSIMTINYNCPHKDRPHYARGMCRSCYWKMRYKTDEEFRKKTLEKIRKAVKKNYEKKVKEDPEFYRKKSREYRHKYPDRWNYILARYYFRKLNDEKRKELIKEVMGIDVGVTNEQNV